MIIVDKEKGKEIMKKVVLDHIWKGWMTSPPRMDFGWIGFENGDVYVRGKSEYQTVYPGWHTMRVPEENLKKDYIDIVEEQIRKLRCWKEIDSRG